VKKNTKLFAVFSAFAVMLIFAGCSMGANSSGSNKNLTGATYTVSVESAIFNGTVSADKTTGIYAGETVTLSVKPETDYKLTELIVTGSGGTAVKTTAVTEQAKYTFTMPESNVNVMATFAEEGWSAEEPKGIRRECVSRYGVKKYYLFYFTEADSTWELYQYKLSIVDGTYKEVYKKITEGTYSGNINKTTSKDNPIKLKWGENPEFFVDNTGRIVNFTGFFMKTNGSAVKLAENGNFINQTESGDYLTNFYDDGTWEFYFVSSGTGIKNSGNRELVLLQGTWTKTEDNKFKILTITTRLNYNTLKMKAVPAEEQEQNTVLETYSGDNGYNEIELECMFELEYKVNPEAYE